MLTWILLQCCSFAPVIPVDTCTGMNGDCLSDCGDRSTIVATCPTSGDHVSCSRIVHSDNLTPKCWGHHDKDYLLTSLISVARALRGRRVKRLVVSAKGKRVNVCCLARVASTRIAQMKTIS